MPRYKVKCSCRGCKSVWWVKKTVKLDDVQKQQLRHSICQECADAYRLQFESVRDGVLRMAPMVEKEIAGIVERLIENKPFGFSRTPFREYCEKTLADDRQTVAIGITTRYRGFSPVREILKYRYRILGMEYALKQAEVLVTD